VEIWKRPSEWDYSWLARVESPAEIILCSIYEHARYALACLPGSFSFPRGRDFSFSAIPQLVAAANIIGPIWFLGMECPDHFNFPHSPYRFARKQVKFDPEDFLGLLDSFSNPLVYRNIQIPILLPSDSTRAAGQNILAEEKKRSGSSHRAAPRRGAGARVRREKVALKNLGALKLCSIMSAPEAIEHTAQTLDHPLFPTESQWSRAQKQARANLAPYHAEAALLWEAFTPR
jgi:hypothetical protein